MKCQGDFMGGFVSWSLEVNMLLWLQDVPAHSQEIIWFSSEKPQANVFYTFLRRPSPTVPKLHQISHTSRYQAIKYVWIILWENVEKSEKKDSWMCALIQIHT